MKVELLPCPFCGEKIDAPFNKPTNELLAGCDPAWRTKVKQQQSLMTHCPATGEPRPYPSHAEQWRAFHGRDIAWLFNPWTGNRRSPQDVGSDVIGVLILPPDEPLHAS